MWRRRLAVVGNGADAVPSPAPAVGARPDGLADRLLARVARGDRQAFAELYDLVAARTYGLVRAVVRDPALAEEVTQEVFVQVWQLAPRFDPGAGRAVAWVGTIAHRRAVDRVRSEAAARARLRRDHGRRLEGTDAPDEAVVDDLDRQRVRAALAALTDRQRQAIELAYYGGHTYEEVAVLLGIPVGTAKTRIRDGLIRLRDALGVGDG